MQDNFNTQSSDAMNLLVQAAAYSADCTRGLLVGGFPGKWLIIASYGVHQDLVIEASTERFLREAVSQKDLIAINDAAGQVMPILFHRLMYFRVRIPRHLDTQSTIIWTLVPRSLGHLIHVHLDRQSERSDAGLHC